MDKEFLEVMEEIYKISKKIIEKEEDFYTKELFQKLIKIYENEVDKRVKEDLYWEVYSALEYDSPGKYHDGFAGKGVYDYMHALGFDKVKELLNEQGYELSWKKDKDNFDRLFIREITEVEKDEIN